MNFVLAYNYTIAMVLILVYLALPATPLNHAEIVEKTAPGVQALVVASSYDNCPCSDDHSSDCCDTTFCNCACHAPLSRGLRLNYSPMIDTQDFREPSWLLLQVYSTIFVPPQNLA